MRAFRSNTAIGIDMWSFLAINEASSDEAMANLSLLLTGVQDRATLPLQALTNITNFIPKNLGGVRPITTKPSLRRIATRSRRPDESDYNSSIAHRDDSAQPNHSSQYSADVRTIIQEICGRLGKPTSIILWDIGKCYDSLDYSLLVDTRRTQGYGSRRTAYTVFVNAAPRMV